MQTTLAASGLGHALSVGAFGCDLCGGKIGTRIQEAGREVFVVVILFGAGLSELSLRLWSADEFLIFLSSLSAKKRLKLACMPTRWIVVGVGLEDGMKTQHDAWFRHYKDRAI
ncbi:hypothetical protein CRG98_008546 [Punica granatum]|uniref:Uncharacterized protein n=1 Tax=Punica granatum TaxID=22663 RepID=A0A2I0KRJ8_PUNGR|nr:hypothetical protein CRG98_008546 [Punica granatum]